jgi:hypothetical protein
MFKVGDKVRIKYPERSTWKDTLRALEMGTLSLNIEYVIASIINNNKDVRLFLPRGTTWGLSAACCVSNKRVRNLPEWF